MFETVANQPVTPDAHGVAVLLLIVVALFLFTRDRLPLESSSLSVLIVLVAGFQILPYGSDGVPLGPIQFLAGFGNEALVAICALMMIGEALATTGALQPLATIVSQTWSTRPSLALLLTLVGVAVLSAFINDTPIVVLMIPILVGNFIAREVSCVRCQAADGIRWHRIESGSAGHIECLSPDHGCAD